MTDQPQQPEQPESGVDASPLIDMYGRFRRRGARMVWISLIAALLIVIIIAVLQPPPPAPDYSKLGIHLLLDDGRGSWPVEQWPEHLQYAGEMLPAGGYVVQVVTADDLDIARWQTLLDLAADHELTPILRLASVYDHEAGQWLAPESDPDGAYTQLASDYADFLSGLNWTTTPYVILLNEVNRGDEWGGRPDPAAYARFVADVAPTIREALPDVQLLNAALDLYAPNTNDQPFEDGIIYLDASTYLEELYMAESAIFDQFDLWNSHPYPLDFSAPPWEQVYRFDAVNSGTIPLEQAPQGVVNRGVNAYTWELWKLETLGVEAKPIMITETGWRHDDAEDAYPDSEAAARLLDMAMRGNPGRYPNAPRTGWTPWLADERVMAVIPFALNGNPDEWSHTNWLRIEPDGGVTGTYPAYDLLAEWSAQAEESE